MSEQATDLKIQGPALLIFAASRRCPRYETQMDVFMTSAEEERSKLPGFIEVFWEGTGETGLSNDESDALRARFGVGTEDFLLVVIDEHGNAVDQYDSPAKTGVILEALGRTREASL